MAASTLIIRLTGMYKLGLLQKVSSAVQETQMTFAKKVGFKSDIKTLTFEGDGSKVNMYVLEAITADIEGDNLDWAAMTTVYGLSKVTTGIPVGETERIYFGSNTDSGGVTCGIVVYCTGSDVASGANVKVAITCPVGQLSPMDMPDVETRNKSGLKLSFSAQKTTTDIAGAALPGVPTDGCFWYFAKLT